MKKEIGYAVVFIYNDTDGFWSLVNGCVMFKSRSSAMRYARRIAENTRISDGRDIPFDEAWKKVADPITEDYGFDPIDGMVSCQRIRVVKLWA